MVLVSSIRIWISFILDNVTHGYPHFCKKAWKIKFKKYHTIFDYDHTSQSTIKKCEKSSGETVTGSDFWKYFFFINQNSYFFIVLVSVLSEPSSKVSFSRISLKLWKISRHHKPSPKKKKKKRERERERKKKFPLKAWTFKNVGFFFLFLG